VRSPPRTTAGAPYATPADDPASASSLAQPDPTLRHFSLIATPLNRVSLRRPIESAQYVSGDYTQTLADHDVLASVGSTGDAYDNSMAESFIDSFKTELITDRVWRTRSQLELAIVEYISWFNESPP
jgi:transposase InsO family protein